MRENFDLEERQQIYLELIEVWKNNETIKYLDLENYQIKKFGDICWKTASLKTRFSKDGVTKLKGVNIRNALRDDREIILQTTRELQKNTLSTTEYNRLITRINNKYSNQAKVLFNDLKHSIETKDKTTLNFVEKAFNTLKVAREFDLKLNKLIDIDDYSKVEIEEIKLARAKEMDKHKIKNDNNLLKLREETTEIRTELELLKLKSK